MGTAEGCIGTLDNELIDHVSDERWGGHQICRRELPAVDGAALGDIQRLVDARPAERVAAWRRRCRGYKRISAYAADQVRVDRIDVYKGVHGG